MLHTLLLRRHASTTLGAALAVNAFRMSAAPTLMCSRWTGAGVLLHVAQFAQNASCFFLLECPASMRLFTVSTFGSALRETGF